MSKKHKKRIVGGRIKDMGIPTAAERREAEQIFEMLDRGELPQPEFCIIVAPGISHRISQREFDELIAAAAEKIGLSREEAASRIRSAFDRGRPKN